MRIICASVYPVESKKEEESKTMAACRCLCVFRRSVFRKNAFVPQILKNEAIILGASKSFMCTNVPSKQTLLKKLPYVCYSTTKSGSETATATNVGTVKGLAEEILKNRVQADSSKEQSGKSEDDTEEEQKKREASWKAMKYSFIAFGASFGTFGVYMLVDWGAPKTDEHGNVIEDEFSHQPLIQQYFLRTWREINYYKKMIRDPSREKLLPDPVQEPYYQPPYTLVLEMTGILVHPDWTYKTGWRFKKRPGVDFFLSQIGPPLFEVVVYTAEQGFTAFPILDALDPNNFITYRLVRDATRYVDGHHVKDLDCLNRDLSKVIVVDCSPHSVKFHNRNAIVLPKWKGNDDDHTLIDLAFFLRTIATSEVGDVREVLDFYHQFDNPVEAFKENQRKLQEQQDEIQKIQKERQEKAASLTGGWTPNFLQRKK